MCFIIQHTEQPATIEVNETTSIIPHGCVIYVGFHRDDVDNYPNTVETFVRKIQSAKIFRKTGSDSINASLTDTGGSILLVPNFTLYSRNHKGSSVDYTHSAKFADGKVMRDHLLTQLQKADIPHITGVFGAEMHITATIDGPINHIRDL